MYYIKAGEVFSEQEILKDTGILIEDGKIKNICEQCDGVDVLSLPKCKIIPGLIDMHIHGANGYDAMDATYESVNEISKYLAANGVTCFLPTTMTVQWEEIIKAIKNIDYASKKGTTGAKILGAYVEGPYITKKYKGAQSEKYIKELSIRDLNTILEVSNNKVKVVTIAPEKENADKAIEYLSDKGVKVSLGHSDATFDQTLKAVECGASIGVHTFNGMRGLHHREPGLAGAVLSLEEIYAELIADTIHVNPQVIKILVKCKGVDKICLISDCMRAGGLKDGVYNLGGQDVNVISGIPRLSNGSLAGSTLKIINAVKNMIKEVGVNPLDAVHMASLVPAKALNIEERMGSIKIGKDANLTVVDENYEVVMTIVDGKIVYKA